MLPQKHIEKAQQDPILKMKSLHENWEEWGLKGTWKGKNMWEVKGHKIEKTKVIDIGGSFSSCEPFYA